MSWQRVMEAKQALIAIQRDPGNPLKELVKDIDWKFLDAGYVVASQLSSYIDQFDSDDINAGDYLASLESVMVESIKFDVREDQIYKVALKRSVLLSAMEQIFQQSFLTDGEIYINRRVPKRVGDVALAANYVSYICGCT